MSTRLEAITQHRLDKLERIRSRGTDPYPAHFHRTHTAQEAKAFFEQQEGTDQVPSCPALCLAGRIVAQRVMGKATFMDIKDGTGKIQVYFRSDSLGEEKYHFLQDFDIGDFIGVAGTLFMTRSGEITLKASDLVMLCKSLQPLPEKWHGLSDVEKRYRQRYLDLIANEEVKDIFEVRSKVIASMRHFLERRGFLEVEAPVLQAVAGGALARPFVTHHHALGQNFYLRIALELPLKRLVVGGFDKVFEIGRIFRNEGISFKHNPEFTMMECYEAYADYRDVMRTVEEMVCCVAEEVKGTTRINYGGTVLDLSSPWEHLTLREAILDQCGIDFEQYPDAASLQDAMSQKGIEFDATKGRGKLIDELLSTFVEPHLIQPTFLLDYPVELSPLAKRKPDNPRLVERFELFIGGMEIANAFTELNDPLEQRERFSQQLGERGTGDEEMELPDEDFLLALEHGMPPTGGLGVGVDRLVMLLTDQHSIREVIFFPQQRTG